jgi:hypothetical protein
MLQLRSFVQSMAALQACITVRAAAGLGGLDRYPWASVTRPCAKPARSSHRYCSGFWFTLPGGLLCTYGYTAGVQAQRRLLTMFRAPDLRRVWGEWCNRKFVC